MNTIMRDALDRMLASLPECDAEGPDLQIRSVLRPVLAIAIPIATQDSEPVEPDPSTCPNCGRPTPAERTPYCSAHCREMAALVRRLRAGLTSGALSDPERQAGMGQALWALQGGGYPRRQMMITEKIKAQVIAKGGGVCSLCGSIATEVDHVTTACNRPINLRAVCASCNRAKGFGMPVTDPTILALYQEIASRIAAGQPLRCCDDDATWDWRAYLKLRNQPE